MRLDRPVALIGPMGAGKSAVGRRLAAVLGVGFRDTDELVVLAHGPIETIFAEQGEARFRELEAAVVAAALESGGVVSLGGGAVLHEGTRALLRERAEVVLLDVDPANAAPRLAGGRRPLIERGGLAEWSRIRAERLPLYRALAEIEIDTGGRAVEEVVAAVAGRLHGDGTARSEARDARERGTE